MSKAAFSDDVRTRVLRFVPPHGSGEAVTVHEINQASGIRNGTVRLVLVEAMEAGRVVRLRRGVYPTDRHAA